MKLAPIVQRLKDQKLGRVYGALELANLTKQPVQLPARFVVPTQWDARPNSLDGATAVSQQTLDQFTIVHMIPGRPLAEDKVSDELHDMEEGTIQAILGWTHPDASRACEAVGGRYLSVNGTALCWATTFRTASQIRKVS